MDNDSPDATDFLADLCESIPLHERLLWLSFLLERHAAEIDPSRIHLPYLRVPTHDGHDSEPMADAVPTAWRTVFRWHGGHFGSRIGRLSAMIS